MSVFLIYIYLTFTHCQEGAAMPAHFTKHRGNGTPSVLNIEWDRSPIALPVPNAGLSMSTLNTSALRHTATAAERLPRLLCRVRMAVESPL